MPIELYISLTMMSAILIHLLPAFLEELLQAYVAFLECIGLNFLVVDAAIRKRCFEIE